MSRKLLAVFSITGLFVVLLGLFSVGHAQEFRHGNNATVGANETLDSTAYLAGRRIDVAGQINGDLYCVGQNIIVSGVVHGDIICAGQNITISGNVDGDVRVAAQTVLISSDISKNLTVGAQDFTLTSTGSIGGDVTGGVDSLAINGTVERDIVLGASDAYINGTVGRNIKSQVESLTLGSNAKVGGDINYTSSDQLNKASGATVAGSVTRSEPKKHEPKSGWFGVGFRIYWFLAMLLVALALVLLAPSLFESSAKRTMRSLGMTLLVGVAATLFTPIIFVLLMITLVGIPLGLIILFGWIMALILSGPFFAYLIGKEIWRAQSNPIWIMLVGAVIVLLVYNIPFIGPIAMLAALFIGMGMLVREITGRSPKPRYSTK